MILTLFLVLIIIILIIFLQKTAKDNFQQQCKFKIKGESYLDCLRLCTNDNNCFYYQCRNECNSCKKKSAEDINKVCPWDIKEEDKLKSGIPNPVVLDVETNEGSVRLFFKTKVNKKYNVDGYVYELYKTNFKDEGVMIGIFSDNECITCEKVIDNLDPNSNYTVSVKAYNKNGISQESNKVTFKPYGTIVSFNYNIPNPIKDELGSEISFCNLN